MSQPDKIAQPGTHQEAQDRLDLHHIGSVFKNLESYLNTDKIKIYYKQYFGWSWPSAIIFYILKIFVFNVVLKAARFWYNSMFRKFIWAKRISLFVYKVVNFFFKGSKKGVVAPPP